jgi:hypothetical protein
MSDQRRIRTAKRYGIRTCELHAEIDKIHTIGRLVMLIVVDDGKASMRRGTQRIEPRDNGLGAIEKSRHFTPLSLILVAPLNFCATCSAATP